MSGYNLEIKNDEVQGDYLNIYNNEIIGCISIYSVIRHLQNITAAKALLILPLTCHSQLLNYIGRANTDVKSIEQLLIRKPDSLANFNERFYSLLRVSTNSILMLSALDFVNIKTDGNIHFINGKDFIPNYNKEVIGKRAMQIIDKSSDIANLLDDKVENLYLQLRVIL